MLKTIRKNTLNVLNCLVKTICADILMNQMSLHFVVSLSMITTPDRFCNVYGPIQIVNDYFNIKTYNC